MVDESAGVQVELVRGELARIEEDLLYTEKSHFAAAESMGMLHLGLGLTTTLCSASAATSLLAQAPTWVAGVLALVAAITSGVLTFVKPEKRASEHLQAGRALGRLRVSSRQARLVELAAREPAVAEVWVARLGDLATQKADIEGASPATSGWMFRAAQRKIQRGDFEHGTEAGPTAR
jgi:hypothetical protein